MSAEKYVNSDISTGTKYNFCIIISYATNDQEQEDE